MRQKTYNRRQKTWDRRLKTGDMRQKTGDVRQMRWDRRREANDMRQETWDRRRETGYVRQETWHRRLDASVVDPCWIRILELPGSRSVFWIWIQTNKYRIKWRQKMSDLRYLVINNSDNQLIKNFFMWQYELIVNKNVPYRTSFKN